VGAANWREPGPALARQTDALLALLAELGLRCTFFILGMAARAHPELVRAIAGAGHEIACHGDAHLPVHTQTPAEFGADLDAACATIEELTGRRPVGYRAPAFSITSQADWAYRVLIDKGFGYDASQHDSFAIRDRVLPAQGTPHAIADGRLWEFPVAVWHAGRARLPVGGASYWSVTPTPAILRGLGRVGGGAGLYLHPQELDPEPLRPGLAGDVAVAQRAQAALRAVQRELARRRAPSVLRAIARSYRLISYGEAYEQLRDGAPTSS
jgi:polysaccharide deacetylase family protein (PEP-CTERM system associated)